MNLKYLPNLFTCQVDRIPNNIAVIYQSKQFTYQVLNQRANQLAYHLQQQGVMPEQLVGLSISTSLEMIVAVLGILKAGGAFVPFDPTYPADRLKVMMQDSQVDRIVTTSKEASHLASQSANLICLDELPTDIPTSNIELPNSNSYNLACCLYTSGSTGRPKGVLIEHQALASHCLAIQAVYAYTTADRGLLFASLNYVAALEQLFMPLLNGACLIIREPELWDTTTFPAKVREYGITVVDLPPGYWHTLLESWQNTPKLIEDLPLRLVILGGEEIRPETVKLWQQSPLRSTHFLNVYGMTETPGAVTLFEIPPDGDFERVPIGRPAPNWQVYLLDEQLQVVPEGEVGEICVGGASLARGYLNQPALTTEKFIDNPVAEGRLYRTGDLGRFLPDGNLEYLGRKDYQVQIRGFRVELGEIEAALLAHQAVKEAVVIAHGEGANKQLAAYAVCQNRVNNDPMQSFWEPDEQYRNEKGVLTNPTERMAFKLQQNNLRSDLTSQIELQKPITDEIKQQYLIRQSYRQFVNKPISLQSLTQFLNCLYQLNLTDTPLPKYRYPSALGLYAVQSYFYFKPDQIEGIDGGFYYYHPHNHELQLIQEDGQIPMTAYAHFDRPTYKQAGFALFLVAHLEAIIPMYGEKLAREFCLLEAGYMGQMLMEEAPKAKLGLCPIGLLENIDPINQGFQFNEIHFLVHSFLGGAIEPAQTKTWLQPTTNQQSPADLKADLQSYLKEKLPPHTVPEQLILREQLPRTPNGKVDRQALANITIETDTSKPYIAPRTPTEQSVVQIWQELFKVEQVSVTDYFFTLGGNSLLALQLLSKIEQQFQVTLPLQILLNHNTVEQLAQQVDTLQSLETVSSDMNQEDYEEGIL